MYEIAVVGLTKAVCVSYSVSSGVFATDAIDRHLTNLDLAGCKDIRSFGHSNQCHLSRVSHNPKSSRNLSQLTNKPSSYVETPVIKEAIAKGLMDQELQKTPMGRAASLDEVSDTIVFMASPMASFMHGAGLTLDGGYSL